MDNSVFILVAATAVAAATPLMLAALGELIIERAGVLNLGVEGMLLIAALVAFSVGVDFGNFWIGIAVSLVFAAVVGALFAWLTIILRCDQVVTGLALNILAAGLTSFLGRSLIGVPPPQVLGRVPVPLLSDIPIFGPVLFDQPLLTYFSFALAPVLFFALFRTQWGLNLRAVGESPDSADATGLSVNGYRIGAVILGSVIIGLAGAHISTAVTPAWTDNLTSGRGWIALALVIFGGWEPVRVLIGALFFGLVEALAYHAQAINLPVSTYALQALPYLFTVVVLAWGAIRISGRRFGAPAALGVPWRRE